MTPRHAWTPEEDGLLRSMGAAGESATAIATLLKHTPGGSAQAGSLTQDQVGSFAARAEGKGKIVVTWPAGGRHKRMPSFEK